MTYHSYWAQVLRAHRDLVLRRTKISTTPWMRPNSKVAVERAAAGPNRTCRRRALSKRASKRTKCPRPNIERNFSIPDLREVRRRFRINDDCPLPDCFHRRRCCACRIRSIPIYAILYQIIQSERENCFKFRFWNFPKKKIYFSPITWQLLKSNVDNKIKIICW